MYIPCSTGGGQDEPRLKAQLGLIHSAYMEMKNQKPGLELVIGGDFNR